MSFHSFGQRGGQRPEVNNTAHYETLGLTKEASETDIKKAFRRLAMQHHPDKGGNPEMFTKIQQAHEVLSDATKRKLYDQGGDEAVERGRHVDEGDGMDIFDIFGGGGRRRGGGNSGPRKNAPVSFQLSLTLEEMFTGVSKKLRLSRSIACKTCDGKGGHNPQTCQACNGRGVRVIMQRLGPGMISQSQQPCDVCNAEGTIIPPASRCNVCHGQKVLKEKKELTVPIPPGAMEGQTHVFTSEGDQQPGQLPGDVIVEFVGKPHDRFERKGRHLFYKLKISLVEALTGFTTFIQHLDGRELRLQSTNVIKPGDVMCVEDQGMPVSFGSGRGIDCGNLYVKFEIVFPTTEQVSKLSKQIKQSLPAANLHRSQIPTQGPKAVIEDISGKSCDMNREELRFKKENDDFRRYLENERSGNQRSRYDDDDDEGEVHMQGGPACQPM